jgi:hypothetical protein
MSVTECICEVSSIARGRNLSASEPDLGWSAMVRKLCSRLTHSMLPMRDVISTLNHCQSTNLLVPVTSCELYIVTLYDFVSRRIISVQQVINL